MSGRLNVLYMHTHDSGRMWGPYGYNVPTPNMMEFAKRATVFRECFCGAPTCSPSRACLLTGCSAHENGMMGLAHRGWRLWDYSRHLGRYLHGYGYETALSGIQHVAPDVDLLGYDHILGSQNFSMGNVEASMEEFDYENTDAAIAFLKDRDSSSSPFFLSMGWFNTHRAYPKARDGINPDYLRAPDIFFDSPETRRDIAEYHESVRVVDNCLGRIMKALCETGLKDNTLIILTTDHGIAWPMMKCTLYDTGIGVALIMDYPGNQLKGRITDALVSQIDIYPTVCEIVAIPKPDWLEGASLVPLFEKKSQSIRSELFAEVTYHAAYEPMRCVRTDRYKLIRYYGNHPTTPMANIDDSVTKEYMVGNGFPGHLNPREALYDLHLDPVERENLVGDSRCQDVYTELSRRLDGWMKKTSDPLCGFGRKVPKPKGAIVNRFECRYPKEANYEAPSDDDWEY